MTAGLRIRRADAGDLDRINEVISDAIGAWELPERVWRLSAPSYRLSGLDLEDAVVWLAETASGEPLAVAHVLAADASDTPAGTRRAALLHGLYVVRRAQRGGIGRQMLAHGADAAAACGCDALVVKAQRRAEPFFLGLGFQPFPAEADDILYPRRLWHALPMA